MRFILTKAPWFINWNYTYKCNFNCEHCYSRTRDYDEVSYEDKVKIAENIIKNNVFQVNLGGGEPIMDSNCIEIIKMLTDNNIFVALSTNGWYIDFDMALALKNAGLNKVNISFDNVDEKIHDESRGKPGSFKKAEQAMKNLNEVGIPIAISTTITSKNFEYLEELIKFASERKCTYVDLKRLRIEGNAKERHDLELCENQKEKLYEQIVRWRKAYPELIISLTYGTDYVEGIDGGCPCGKTAAAILPNGDFAPCVYNTYVLGNVLEEDISALWHCKELNYLRENFECLGMGMKKRGENYV